LGREEEVLHHLLRDGRGAQSLLAADRVHGGGPGKREEAEARVLVEVLVLRADHRLHQHAGNLVHLHHRAAFPMELADDRAGGGATGKGGRRGAETSSSGRETWRPFLGASGAASARRFGGRAAALGAGPSTRTNAVAPGASSSGATGDCSRVDASSSTSINVLPASDSGCLEEGMRSG